MRTIVALGLALMASPAFAQNMGMYVGGGFGNFDFQDDTSVIDPTFGVLSDTVSSWKIYGGFEFTDNFGLEISYGQTSDIEDDFSGTDPVVGPFTGALSGGFTTTTAKGMGYLPFEWGALLAGVGYFDTELDVDLSLSAAFGSVSASQTVSENGATAMLGVEWRFGRLGTGFGIRLEYEWLDIDAADASSIGIGASYRF